MFNGLILLNDYPYPQRRGGNVFSTAANRHGRCYRQDSDNSSTSGSTPGSAPPSPHSSSCVERPPRPQRELSEAMLRGLRHQSSSNLSRRKARMRAASALPSSSAAGSNGRRSASASPAGSSAPAARA